ncbi:MAG: hypothetical protein D6722_21555 [Bacteroidetes bacterium]|nr:MAG: hypothetical protein D6722_21555 [Bacteroidota bacterium]
MRFNNIAISTNGLPLTPISSPMHIVPALYIKDGKAAAYRPGDYLNLSYLDRDPYDLIQELSDHHIQRIMLVDVDASLDNPQHNMGLIGSLANTTIPDLEVAGGISNMDYLKSLQYAGVDYFVLGSAMFDNFAFVEAVRDADHVDNDRIMVAFDLLDGQLTCHGWTREQPDQDLFALIQKTLDNGFRRCIVSHINTQQPEAGPDLDFYRRLRLRFPDLILTAAGHIHSFEHIDALRDIQVDEVVIGNEIYQQPGLMAQISAYNEAEGEA